MNGEYTVYKHTSPNGKVYIGITRQEPKQRWKNGHGYRNNEHFYRAIQKYGWDNFKHEILFSNLPENVAWEKEIELIKAHKSNQYEFGYNISSGGEIANGCKCSEETKLKISKANRGKTSPNKGKKMTDEQIRKMSERLKGRTVWNKGKTGLQKHSEETRKKMSESQKMAQTKHRKSVLCVETGVIYNSIRDAEKQTGARNSDITAVCKGKRKKAGGYTWKYAA